MKNYLLLSVIPFLSFFAPAWSADTEAAPSSLTPLAIDKTSPKLSEQDAVIQELLSQKFHYFGEDLNGKIQKIGSSSSFEKLTSSEIEIFLGTEKDGKERKEGKKNNKVLITVFLKKEDSKLESPIEKDKAFRNALLASAYFPVQLEPQIKSTPLFKFASFKFMHKQLAYALFYGHPLAGKYLKEIASISNVPLKDDDDFYENFYKLPNLNIHDYSQHIVQVDLISGRKVTKDSDEDINEKINFSPYSEEMLSYFQTLIHQNPKK